MLRRVKLAGQVFATVLMLGFSFTAPTRADIPLPEQAVELDLHRPWLDAANWDQNVPPVVYGADTTLESPRFSVVDPNALSLWICRLSIPIDLQKYPILHIRYRAHGASPEAEHVLRLVADKDGNRNRIDVWKGSDLVADDKEHELKQDLRELNADGSLTTFGIYLRSTTSPATLDLLEVRFAAETPLDKLKDDATAVRVRVTDQNDVPLAGAKIIVDAERSNFARSADTDKNGEAVRTPLANEQGKHMLRVEKDGYLPLEFASALSESGQALLVKMIPATTYGGVARDASGNVAALSQISIKLKADLLEQLPMRFTTNIVTDEKGQWSSGLLPADASRLLISLTTRDNAGKPQVAQLDAANLKQGGAGKSRVTSVARSASAKPSNAEAKAPDKPKVEPITAIVQKVDDSTTGLGWTGVDGDQILVVLHPQPNKDESAKIPLKDITDIQLKKGGGFSPSVASASTRPANTLPNSRVTLAGEDRLLGTVSGWSDKKLSIHPNLAPANTIEIPVADLRQLWCGTADQIKKAQALKEEPGLEDIAYATKEDEVVAVRGVVLGIDDDALHFRYDNADRKIGLNRLVGITMAKAEDAPSNDSLYEVVQFVNDDQISGKMTGIEGKELMLQMLGGTDVRVPIDQIAKISTRNGRLVYLSDLKPTKVEQTPYFDRLIEYRVDKSLNGKPITLSDGTYAHGISVHSRCLLTYNLDSKFSDFRSKVGFLLPDGKIGDCVIRVIGDGKTIYEKLDARGDQAPLDLKLNVNNVRELTLEVDFGKNDDVGDRVAWANARLLRAEIQK